MGLLQDRGFTSIGGNNANTSSTGLLQQRGFTTIKKLEPLKKIDTSTKKSTNTFIDEPINEKKGLFSSALDTVKKIGNNIKIRFTTPTKKVETKRPDTPIAGSSATLARQPIQIKEGQKKLTFEQLRQIGKTTTTSMEKPTLGKLGKNVALSTLKMATDASDFFVDYLANNYNKLGLNNQFQTKESRKKFKEWKSWYNKQDQSGKIPTEQLKRKTNELFEKTYSKPSQEWEKATITEKVTKRLPETIYNLAPGVISSLGLYIVNMPLAITTTIGSTGEDVKQTAIDYGVERDKAEKIGLGVGFAVAFLDRIVPEQVLTKGTKKEFSKSFLKRFTETAIQAFKTGSKEALTEVAQENIQIIAEKTFRNDLGWDEIKTRNVLAGLGGLIGGTGIDVMTNVAVDVIQPNIDESVTEKKEETVDIPEGEYTPQEVAGKVIADNKQDTPEGKELLKAAAEAQKRKENIIIEKIEQVLQEDTKAKTEKPTTIQGIDQAINYVSADDFADAVYSAQKTDQIGTIEPDRVTARDVTDDKAVQDYIKKIESGKSIEPVEVRKQGDGFITTEGSHRTKAYQELNREIPIIFRGKEKIDGLSTIEEVYNEAQQQPKKQKTTKKQTKEKPAKPKVVEVPRSQLPVGTGKVKANKLEARLKGVIDNATPEQIERLGLSTSNTAKNNKQLTDAAKYVSENPKEAMDVLEGKIDPPKGLLKNSIFIAMTKLDDIDMNLATKLAAFSSKRYGQEIQILSQIEPNSTISILKQIYIIKEEAAQKKYGKDLNKKKKEVKKNIKKHIKTPSKYDWNEFISSLEC